MSHCSHCSRWNFVIALLALGACCASAQQIVPSPLLAIDQNRTTVVERIVNQWGDSLAASNAGIGAAELRQMLAGMRADQLLAASLVGSLDGLRAVVSGALVHADAAVSSKLVQTKSLGDTADDLVYTPVVPCRIVDTRLGAGGVFLPGNQRNWLAYSPSGFASQGGSATGCGIPVRPVAIMANTTLANTVGGPEFFELWPFNQARPNASTVNWWASGQQPANAEVVPLCTGGGCTFDFSAYASGQTHAIIDVLGYFSAPNGGLAAQRFADGFEAPTIDPFWTTSQQLGSITRSADVAHIGAHSVKFSSSSGGQRNIILSHAFASPTKGAFVVWFYDDAPGQETLYENLTLSNLATGDIAYIGTQDFDANCYTAFLHNGSQNTNLGPNANCGIFPQTITTSITRTVGWHQFDIRVEPSGVTFSIDNTQVFTTTGDYKFDHVSLIVTGPGFRPDTVAYFDDFSFTTP